MPTTSILRIVKLYMMHNALYGILSYVIIIVRSGRYKFIQCIDIGIRRRTMLDLSTFGRALNSYDRAIQFSKERLSDDISETCQNR